MVASGTGVEYLRWPVSRKPELVPSREAFERSPDFWGLLSFRCKSNGNEGISAPEVATAPKLDGQLSEGEWAAADKRTMGSGTGAAHTIYALRTEQAVYVAVVATALDGPRRDEAPAVRQGCAGRGAVLELHPQAVAPRPAALLPSRRQAG